MRFSERLSGSSRQNGFATLRQNRALTDGLILALCASATVVTLGLWQPSITLPEAVGNAGGISTANHLHISCGLVCVSTVARCCRRAVTARGSRRRARRKSTPGRGRTRAPARPSSNLAVYGRRSRGMHTKHRGRNRRNCEFRRCHPQRAGWER